MFRPTKKKDSKKEATDGTGNFSFRKPGGGISPTKSSRLGFENDRQRNSNYDMSVVSGVVEGAHQHQTNASSTKNENYHNNNINAPGFPSDINNQRDEKSEQGMRLIMKQQMRASKLRRASAAQNNATKENLKKLRKLYVSDPSDPTAAGDLVSMIIPIRPPTTDPNASAANAAAAPANKNYSKQKSSIPMSNECLLALRVKSFEFSGNALADNHAATTGDLTYGTIRKNISHINPKSKNKLRYICITRSTNLTLMKKRKGKVLVNSGDEGDPDHDEEDDQDSSSDEDDHDADSTDGYDTLYNPDDDNQNGDQKRQQRRISTNTSVVSKTKSKSANEKDNEAANEIVEQSSFPSLVCLAIHSDGTHPDIRKILPLDSLVAIENVANKQSVQLVFQNGVVAEIDFDIKLLPHGTIGGTGDEVAVGDSLKKERFLWSLLQIHALLCTSVIERNLSRGDANASRPGSRGYIPSSKLTSSSTLPTLTMRNVDRAELQYISTVNGFLSDSPVLCALLERHRHATAVEKGKSASGSASVAGGNISRDPMSSSEEKKSAVDEMDGIAYDMIMGNFSNLTLFLTEEEKQDAEEVLNSTIWQEGKGDGGDEGKVNVDEISTAESLTGILQKRMRDLETETCRRLIAWEDEKYYNSTGNIPVRNRRDTMDALSLSVLFKTLDDLDEALEGMEDWLSDRAATIKPLTDECREVEEENRQLGFQRNSYRLISDELKRLLSGLEVPNDVESILRNPSSKMVYHGNGSIDIIQSQAGVEDIYQAGRALKEAFDRVKDEGGVHLRGVKDRVEGLLNLSYSFCESVANTIIDIMQRTVAEIGESDDFDYLSSTHATIGKTIRAVRNQCIHLYSGSPTNF